MIKNNIIKMKIDSIHQFSFYFDSGFVNAIFYIGKGKKARAYSHFKEAMQHLGNPTKR